MKAKEWLFENYPNVKEDWCKTVHDDKFMARMMDEYHEAQLKLLNLHIVSNNEVTVCLHPFDEVTYCEKDIYWCRKCEQYVYKQTDC